MGERTTISGHIQEAWYLPSDEAHLRLLEQLNTAAIEALPDVDEDPFLTRSMFKFSAWSEQNTYRGRVIYFGGSFHSIWMVWPAWLDKFEALLRRMYWEHAALIMVTEYVGTHSYEWRASIDTSLRYAASPPVPPQDWEFTGGPREF